MKHKFEEERVVRKENELDKEELLRKEELERDVNLPVDEEIDAEVRKEIDADIYRDNEGKEDLEEVDLERAEDINELDPFYKERKERLGEDNEY